MFRPASAQTNSSPPQRMIRSWERSLPLKALTTSSSIRSPAAWPRESLIALRWSTSTNASTSGCSDRLALLISRSSSTSPAPRRYAPVRPSWDECSRSLADAPRSARAVSRSCSDCVRSLAPAPRSCEARRRSEAASRRASAERLETSVGLSGPAAVPDCAAAWSRRSAAWSRRSPAWSRCSAAWSRRSPARSRCSAAWSRCSPAWSRPSAGDPRPLPSASPERSLSIKIAPPCDPWRLPRPTHGLVPGF